MKKPICNKEGTVRIMLKLNVGGKELKVKYGYEATLKSRLLSKVAKLQSNLGKNDKDVMESMEELLLVLPEMLLIGLQKYHPEYKYDVEKGNGKDKFIPSMFDLIEEYCDTDDKDAYLLFGELQEEMMSNGFLRSLFQKLKEVPTEQK